MYKLLFTAAMVSAAKANSDPSKCIKKVNIGDNNSVEYEPSPDCCNFPSTGYCSDSYIQEWGDVCGDETIYGSMKKWSCLDPSTYNADSKEPSKCFDSRAAGFDRTCCARKDSGFCMIINPDDYANPFYWPIQWTDEECENTDSKYIDEDKSSGVPAYKFMCFPPSAEYLADPSKFAKDYSADSATRYTGISLVAILATFVYQ